MQNNLTSMSLLIAERQDKLICYKKLAYTATHTAIRS